MATRVNVRFVVILSAALIVVFGGVAGVLVALQLMSGDRYARLGDAAMAAGNYTDAEEYYSKAVYREKGNLEWLDKWRSAIEHMSPESHTRFFEFYGRYVRQVLMQIARVKETDVEAHREYLDAVYQGIRMYPAGPDDWDRLAEEAESSLRYFDQDTSRSWWPLRRYRGIGLVNKRLLGGTVDETDIARASEDLRAALETTPTDGESARALVGLHLDLARRADDAKNDTRARVEREEAGRVIDALLRAAPTDPVGLVTRLRLSLVRAEPRSATTLRPGELARLRREAFAALKPELERALADLGAAASTDVTAIELRALMGLGQSIDGQRTLAGVLALADRALAERPDDVDLMMLRAELLERMNDGEGALAQLQKIVDMPPQRISLLGAKVFSMRPSAIFLQAQVALNLVAQSEAGALDSAALERAEGYIQSLLTHQSEDSPAVKYLRAKVLIARGDLPAAERLLIDFGRATAFLGREGMDAKRMLARIAVERGQLGRARDYYREIVESNPDDIRARLDLASAEARVQRPAAAREHYEYALALDPTNEDARRGLELMSAYEGSASASAAVSDPVDQALVQAELLRRGTTQIPGDSMKAIEYVRPRLDRLGHDPRLYAALAYLRLDLDQIEEALAAVEQGLAHNPNHELLGQLRLMFDLAGNPDEMIKRVMASDAPEGEKQLQLYKLYKGRNMMPEARTALARAAALLPDDPRLIIAQFDQALVDDKLDEAQRLQERAAKMDADQADGLTFLARLQIAQGKFGEAERSLQRATERGTATAAVYRLLGALQRDLGRSAQSLESYRQALNIDPTSIGAAKDYIRALDAAGRRDEALAVARQSRTSGARDREFQHIWMLLEAAAGNLALATQRREELQRIDANDRVNAAALCGLYMDQRRWDDAKRLLTQVRASGDALSLVRLAARWHADQGDLASAKAEYDRYIEAQGTALDGSPFREYARFLIDHGRVDEALAVLERGAPHQDKAQRDLDVLRGDTLFRLGRFQQAETVYRAVMDAGVDDPSYGVRTRVVDAMLQQGEYADVERFIKSIGAGAEASMVLSLQRADAARGLGDRRRARELLDQVVARFPDEMLPYVRRAALLSADEFGRQDALADLNRAVQLRPGNLDALRARADLYTRMGRVDEALSDLRAAVEANPTLDVLRTDLIARQIKHNRISEALSVAEDGARLKPNDARYLTTVGGALADAGQWRHAATYYRRVWEVQKGELTAFRLALSLLRATPPDLQGARAVLTSPAPGLEPTTSIRLMVLTAELERRQGRTNEALAAGARSAVLAGSEPAAIASWYGLLRQIIEDPAAALMVLDAAAADPRLPERVSTAEWLNFFRCVVMVEMPTRRSEGMSTLAALAERAGSPAVKLNAYKIYSAQLNRDADMNQATYAKVAEAMEAGLRLAPEDPELNNNYAYLLARHLDRATEAKPFAERALARMPDNPVVLDTMGTVQRALGQLEAARDTLQHALAQATAARDRIVVMLHLARVRAELRDGLGADDLMRDVRSLLADHPELREGVAKELAEVEEAVRTGR